MKRLFDVAVALVALVVLSPFLALIALAVKVTSGGPVFHRGERIGRGGAPFRILKFRTMRANVSGPAITRGGDARITPLGRVLRRWKLDELPQLVNVLRGELSAVGPRPLTAFDVERLQWTSAECDFRWSVTPGLTGLAQVVGARSPRHALRLDRCYIARQTLGLDVRLVAWSFVINVLGKRRVQRIISRRPPPDTDPSTCATSSSRRDQARPTTDRARPCPNASPPRG
jgi:lipopolysaccharide/colanic/teichoic acid biosynthesis glycosyltransferase